MPLTIRNHLAHMRDVVLVVLLRVLLRVFLQNGDDFAAAVSVR